MNEEIQKISLLFTEYGPSITQSQTAKLLKRSTARIAQMIKEGKLEIVPCMGIRMVTIRSIIKWCNVR